LENLNGRELGRPKHGWEDIIKMDLKETGCEDVDWILLSEDRVQWWVLVKTIINLWAL
jgi:hypothetical protein